MINIASGVEPLKYNGPQFPKDMRRYGCRFSCLRAIPEFVLGQALDITQILEIYSRASHDPNVMGIDCTMRRREDLVINWSFTELGQSNFRGCQVGKMKGDHPLFWNKPVPFQFIIGHWKTLGPDGHFTLFDANGEEIWDGYDSSLDENGYQITKIEIDAMLLYYVWQVKGA